MATTSALHSAATTAATESLPQLLEEGARLRDAGDAAGALELYRRALALDPDNAEAVRNFGLVACRLGRFAEAEPYVERALALAPADGAYRREIATAHMSIAGAYMARGDGASALAHLRRALAVDPDNPNAIRNFGLAAARLGRFDEAAPCVARALADAPLDNAYRAQIAALHIAAAGASAAKNDVGGAIGHLRRAVGYDPSFPEARNNLAMLVNWLGRPGELADFAPGLTPDSLGHHLLIACMPKSGSSFLSAALCAATGWPVLPMSYGYMQNEQDIHLPFLLARPEANTVTQQHCRATIPNVQILQAFGIRPIVLVRNLFDVVLSLADFYDGGAVGNTFFPGRWEALAPERKHDLIVDHVMPWYVTFFASWMDVIRTGWLDARLVSYDAMIADKPGTLAAILAHQGLTKSAQECAAAIAAVDGGAAQTRLNKGVGGRGVAALTEAQKDRIRRLAGYYPDIDFSAVGL